MPAVTTTTIITEAAADITTATQGDITLVLRGGATTVPRIAMGMGMMLRLRLRGMEVARRRLDMGLRRRWAMHHRGGIEGRHGWLEKSVMLR